MKNAAYYIEQLKELFESHHVNCELVNDIIIFPEQHMEVALSLHDRTMSVPIIQMDVSVSVGLGNYLIDSVAGFGDDLDKAADSAWENFVRNSFHVILAAFFTDEYDDQVLRKEMLIGGKKFEVVQSHLGIRGKLPEAFHTGWLDQFEHDLSQSELTDGIHWIRFFYSQDRGEITTCEVLFDNEIWEELQSKASDYNYAEADNFYSVRLLLIVQNKPDMSRLAKIMATVEQEEAEKEFINYGLSSLDAVKAYLLIQHALGQVLLKKILRDISFSDEAVIVGQDEKEYKITLRDEFFYTEALKLGDTIFERGTQHDHELFQSIAMTSAEFNAINNALNDGSTLENFEGARFSEVIMNIPEYKG